MAKISRVLILGSTGLVGHGISSYLLQKNFYVFGTSYSKKIRSINSNFRLYKNINLTDPKSFFKINKIIKKNKIQAIINSAALIPNKLNYNKKYFYEKSIIINLFSYFELYKIIKKNKIKCLINISTPNVKEINSKNIEMHHNFYIYTKYLAEMYLSNIQKSDLNIVSLRTKSPYGYILNTKAVIPNFINRLKKNKKLILKGNTNKKIALTFVEDIGASCEYIFKKNISGVWNCIGHEQISIKKLALLVDLIFSKKITTQKYKNLKFTQKIKYKKNINLLKTSVKKGLIKILKNEKLF